MNLQNSATCFGFFKAIFRLNLGVCVCVCVYIYIYIYIYIIWALAKLCTALKVICAVVK